MGIGLVAYVPNDSVPGGIEDIVKGQSQLYDSKAGSQVPPHLGDGLNNLLPDLLGQRGQVG
jgi:hypothetical protein